ncbi:MAG: histidine--tRNA ligase [Candidatus Omnitrophica bacterium]|nr:histidine--tRNA ligase [Candidatus Omnitrophota bacterium]
MKYQALKGMMDILPDQVWKWQFVESVSRNIFNRFNFQEIRTPILESLPLFQRSIGEETDIVQKEMFQFKDRGDRDVVMRPEVTASVVRAFVEHQLKDGKLYYIGASFRAERPQAGRFRQFHQVGAELIGGKNPEDDVLLLKVLTALLAGLGLRRYQLKINSVGCQTTCRPEYRKVLKEYLKQKHAHLCENCQRRIETNIIRIFDCKVEGCQKAIEGAPRVLDHLCKPCEEHFAKVKELLDHEKDIPYQIEPRIVRGLDYYNRTVFEVSHDALGAQNAVGGGGRYDTLVGELGGSKDIGACGFACGMERLLMALDSEEGFKTEESAQRLRCGLIYLCVLGGNPELKTAARKIQGQLRGADFRVEELAAEDKPLKKHLEIANRLHALFVLILGEDEFREGTVSVKDMNSGTQEKIKLDAIETYLKGRLVSR